MPNPIYRLLTWFVLLLGLAGSGAVSYWMKSDIETGAYQEFIHHCAEIQLKIIARLKAHEQTLLGGAAMFDASQTVERQEWYAYAKRLRISEHFNGIQGLGFALSIPSTQLSTHQASIRAEGFPDYKVWPEGERELYTAIVYLEPFIERNLRAFGYDMYSEPVRRAAMERARDENIVALSGRVMLVQETDENVQAGNLMYVPVYKKGQAIDTIEQRRAALFGWVYSPFRMSDLLNNIVSYQQNNNLTPVHLRVYDGYNTQAEHLLYDNNAKYPDTQSIGHRSIIQLTNDFNGTIWTLQFEQIMGVGSLDYSKAWISLGTGVFISFLLFVLSSFYLNMRVNAVNIATKLTRELQESESRFRVLADNAPVLVWIAGLDKLFYHFNKTWLDFTGRTLEQEQGNGWAEGVHADDFQGCLNTYVTSFDARLPFKMEYRLRRYDGEYRWILDNGVPRFADDGTFLGYIGSCIDITERKQTQAKIEKSLSLLHATLESSSDAVLVVDLNNTWVLYNQKFIDLWQITNDIITGRDDNAALSYVLGQLEDAEGFLNKVHELYRSPENSSFDIINFKSGKIVERYSVPQRINGNVVGRVWSFRDVTERVRAEHYLQKESEKNQALLRNASDGIHILDTEGNIIEISDSFCNMLGYSREEILGMNVTQWDACFSADECIRVLKQVFEKHTRSLFETRHRCKDGRIIDVEVSSFPLELGGKSVLFNSSRDITERKKLEVQLHNISSYTRSLIEASLDPLVTISADGKITDVNKATEKITGYTREELIHSDFSDYFTDSEQASAGYREVFSKGQVTDYPLVIKHRDGYLTDVLYNATVYKNENSEIAGVFAAARDITKLKQIELELIKQQQQLQNIITGTNAGTWEWNVQTGELILNERWANIIGYDLSELQPVSIQTWIELCHPDDLKHSNELLKKHFAGELGYYDCQCRMKHKQGHWVWVLDRGQLISRADDGKPLFMAGVHIDISEIKQTEAQLRVAATVFESQEGMLITDANEVILSVNQAFTRITGYSTEEVMGKTPRLLHSGRQDEAFYQTMWQSLNETGAWRGEIWNRRKNGAIYPEWLTITAVKANNDEHISHYVATLIDISERKQVENALQESRVLLQTAQRAARLGHYVLDLRNRTAITWTNDDLFDEIFGIDEYFVHDLTNLAKIIHPDDLPQMQYILRQICRGQKLTSMEPIEYRIIRPADGRECWIEAWGHNFYDDKDHPVWQAGMVQDISERKHMEMALKANEAKFRSMIEIIPVPMALNDGHDNFIYLNPAFIQTFGYELDETPTVADWQNKVYPDTDYQQWVNNTWKIRLEEVEREHGPFKPLELNIRCKDGTERTVLACAATFQFAFDAAPYLFVLYDITERKQAELAKRASEEQLRAFYELDLVGLTITSPEKGWIRINNCLCNMLEYSEQELRQMTWVELTYPEDLNTDIEQFEKLLANEINGYALEKRFVSRTGKIIPTRLVVRCVRKANGEVDYVMAMVEDITEYKNAEAQLHVAATVFESQEGMLITDANQVILNVNRAFMLITGYSADELIGQTPRMLKSGRHDKDFYNELWQQVNEKGAWQGEIWNRRKNDDIYPEWLTITAVKDDDGIVTNYVATITDITERKAAEEYINRLAFYDPLTQLPNRRLLQERIKHGIILYHRTGSKMAVLMMDLDKFKAVNDSLGHAAGDELLQQVAKRIKARLREMDMVARLGGDEFVILIDNVTQHEHIARIAESLIHTLSQAFTLCGDHDVYIGASIGIAIYPEHGDSEEAIMDNADIALYHAKAKGRGCFVYFSEALTEKIKEHAIKETRLRHAIEHQELQVFFQPQMDINSGQVVGAEALVLWYHPTYGYFMPNEFLDLAEETGLIVTIGEWLLRETCKFGRQWLDEGLPAVTLAVNVSPYQFSRRDIGALVTQILNETGFPAKYLALEITETGLMNNQEQADTILNQLHEQSVHLVIDDFGKGYSSLAYLKHFPLDILKIDKSFIDDLPFSPDDCAITSSIIAMAHHLDLKVLAEGVETVPQLQFLRLQGCDQYQSVHSEALPVSEFVKLLAKLRSA